MGVIVYPFDETFLPVLHFLSEDPTFKSEISLISPRGWGLVGKKYNYGKKTFIVESDFKKNVNECSEIWIVNSRYDLNVKKYIIPLINNVDDKKIIICRRLSINEKDEINKNLKTCKVIFANESNIDLSEELNEHLFHISVPVVFVAGVTESTDKFKVQLHLYSELSKIGYNVGLLSSSPESILCGIPTLPELLYDEQISTKRKILLLNQFIKKYELCSKPEILIIGVPGEILMLSNYYIGHGGAISHIISQTVSADSVILCSMYNEISSSNLIDIGDQISKRLGSNVKYHAVTNKTLNYEETESEKRISYLTLSNDFVLKNSENYIHDNIYFSFLDKDIKRMTSDIIEELSS